MRLLPAAFIVLCVALPCVAAPTPAPESAKVRCPQGYVCFPLSVAADIDARLIQLDADLRVAKAKNRRWGGVVGCGPFVGLAVRDSKVDLNGYVGCGAVLGLRF